MFCTVSALSQSPQKVGAPELQIGKHGEEESAEKPLDSADHRANAETVTRGYSFDMGRREDGGEDPVRNSGLNEHAFHAQYTYNCLDK